MGKLVEPQGEGSKSIDLSKSGGKSNKIVDTGIVMVNSIVHVDEMRMIMNHALSCCDDDISFFGGK